MGRSKSNPKREVQSDIGLPQETRKKKKINLTYYLKQLEKENATSKVSRRKEGKVRVN